jgi:hypothetical protein
VICQLRRPCGSTVSNDQPEKIWRMVPASSATSSRHRNGVADHVRACRCSSISGPGHEENPFRKPSSQGEGRGEPDSPLYSRAQNFGDGGHQAGLPQSTDIARSARLVRFVPITKSGAFLSIASAPAAPPVRSLRCEGNPSRPDRRLRATSMRTTSSSGATRPYRFWRRSGPKVSPRLMLALLARNRLASVRSSTASRTLSVSRTP